MLSQLWHKCCWLFQARPDIYSPILDIYRVLSLLVQEIFIKIMPTLGLQEKVLSSTRWGGGFLGHALF